MENENTSFKLAHIGINCSDADTAISVAQKLAEMFNYTNKEGNSSVFVGREIEVMKEPFYGTHGHIAFETNNLEEAIVKLQKEGFEFRMDTLKSDENGKKQIIYLKDEVGGFAIHLLQAK
jgi:2-dehydro-3-deoxyphosphogluconate aldolase / (4S)-4-hydroxy-2-oxoglutarate aldolase